MTIQMLENKFDKFVAFVGLVGREINKLQAEIRAAREAEEALQEAAYQAACREEEEGFRMLEALGNEDLQMQDYSEKYMMHVAC